MDQRIGHTMSYLKLQKEIDFSAFQVYPKAISKEKIISIYDGSHYGFMDLEEKWISPCIYDDIIDFQEGMAVVGKNGIYGYLHKSGEIAIPLQFQKACPFTEGFAAAEKDGKYGVINQKGETVIPFIYDRIFPISEGLFPAVLNGKHGFINLQNEVVIPFEYEEVNGGFSNGLASVLKKKWGFIDKTGTLIISHDYIQADLFLEDYCAVYLKRKKCGLIDKKGNVILPFENNEIYSFCDFYFNDGLCAVKRNGKWGFVNKENEQIIPCRYSDTAEFCEGFAAVCKNGKWGFVNTQGKEVIPCSYTDIWAFFENGIAGVKADGQYTCIDEKNQRISPLADGWMKRIDKLYFQYDKNQNKLLILEAEQSSISDLYWSSYDFEDFWEENEYSLSAYKSDFLTEDSIGEIEEQVKYKLPLSYIELMKLHNGGLLKHASYLLSSSGISEQPKEIILEGILGIGKEKAYSLGGAFGSRFWIEDGEYPDIGVAICTCCSEDQDMIFLDYRDCGREGEPSVSYINPEHNFNIIKIAENFEKFIEKIYHS